MTDITTKVGRYSVKDGSAAVKADADDNVTLTAKEWLGYERRAAQIVLLEAPEIGGAEFKFARKALAFTQPELAELLAVAACTVSHWETGNYPITRQTALAVAALLQQALQGPDWPPKAWFEARKEPVGKR